MKLLEHVKSVSWHNVRESLTKNISAIFPTHVFVEERYSQISIVLPKKVLLQTPGAYNFVFLTIIPITSSSKKMLKIPVGVMGPS